MPDSPLPPPESVFNRNWSLLLLAVNAVLVALVLNSDYNQLDDSILLVLGPLVFLGLLVGIIHSLPRPLDRPFKVLLGLGTVGTVLLGMLLYYAANFLRGKW